MKSRLLLLTVLASATAVLLAFSVNESSTSSFINRTANQSFQKNIVRCGPDWEALETFLEETDIPPVPGAGSHQWKISTTNDSAQFYFNQGMNMYYSFHIIEAMASFKKAAKFDPGCAMLYWAQALAYGPNINDVGYTASPDALLASGKAIEYCGPCTEKEEMLIRAQRSRYSDDSTETREKLNQVYVDLMKEAYDQYPADPDVAALYADALMLQHPWDLWKTDGTPKPWTPLIRSVLEKLLIKYPNHPGANHYYIHVMEPSPYFAKAIPSADRLGKITPALSHTVHMPSHIYLRTGNYSKGVTVNEQAVGSYQKLTKLYAPVAGNDFLYVIHNLHMQTNNAMLGGYRTQSMIAAEKTVNSIPKDYLAIPAPMGSYVQYIYSTPVLVHIRFGNWQSLLDMPQPAATQVYSNALYHFGRGMAFAATAKITEAKNERAQLQQLMKDSSLFIPFTPFSPAIDGLTIAEQLLTGTIALNEQHMDLAIAAFQKAVTVEENMVYNEPRDWLLNPKHYLGNALLKAGRYAAARQIFLADLKNNNENGWALYGAWQAFTAEKNKTEADKMLLRFRKAFSKADIKITSAVY
jgi:tetratricopeptide (TPR) repeat protein